jgi:rhamnosyl/mannosyltransferase
MPLRYYSSKGPVKALWTFSKSFLNDVDVIVATSSIYADTSPTLKDYREKVEIIPLGLSSHTLPNQPNKELANKRQERRGDGFSSLLECSTTIEA